MSNALQNATKLNKRLNHNKSPAPFITKQNS